MKVVYVCRCREMKKNELPKEERKDTCCTSDKEKRAAAIVIGRMCLKTIDMGNEPVGGMEMDQNKRREERGKDGKY